MKGRGQLQRREQKFGLDDGKVHFVRRLGKGVWNCTQIHPATRNTVRNDFAEVNHYVWKKSGQ